MMFSRSFLVAALVALSTALPTQGISTFDKKTALAGGSGDGTYYDTGLGACGWSNSDDQWVVALAPADYAGGALCGDAISIWYGGKQVWAQVVDLCTGCATGSIDMTPSLFQQFAGLDAGRINGVTWWVNS